MSASYLLSKRSSSQPCIHSRETSWLSKTRLLAIKRYWSLHSRLRAQYSTSILSSSKIWRRELKDWSMHITGRERRTGPGRLWTGYWISLTRGAHSSISQMIKILLHTHSLRSQHLLFMIRTAHLSEWLTFNNYNHTKYSFFVNKWVSRGSYCMDCSISLDWTPCISSLTKSTNTLNASLTYDSPMGLTFDLNDSLWEKS